MNKRDLEKDLEIFRNSKGGGNYTIYQFDGRMIAGHAIERAIQAESLVRELVGVLEGVQRLKPLIAYPDDVLPEFGEEAMAIANMLNVVDSVVIKAKEVLGDEN